MSIDREQVKRESYSAAVKFLGIDPHKYRPVVQELELNERERTLYTHKFSVLVADESVLVYRIGPEEYVVIEEPDESGGQSQEAEKEATKILMTASRYLEVQLRHVKNIGVVAVDVSEHEDYHARWSITLDGLTCDVIRRNNENEQKPAYEIVENS